MMGITETVFAPKPPKDNKDEPNTIPMSILKQMKPLQNFPESNLVRNAGPPKIKRPMETNRLESGPPKAKFLKVSPRASIVASQEKADPGVVRRMQVAADMARPDVTRAGCRPPAVSSTTPPIGQL